MSSAALSRLALLDADAIATAMPMPLCIEIVDAVMRAVSNGEADIPLRSAVAIGASANRLGVMPGALAGSGVFGAKLLALFPDNPRQGRSSHLGVVVLFDSVTGEPIALLDAAAITSLRTAAASAVATRALARSGSQIVAILGTGEQARAHAHVMPHVMPITTIRIWGRDCGRAERLANELRHALDLDVTAPGSMAAALDGADILCTATSARSPLIGRDDLWPGVHVNLIGASTPDHIELTSDAVRKTRYFVDHLPSAFAQAAELIRAREVGPVAVSEIGNVLLGRADGRGADDEITAYRSLGIVAQDLAVAAAIARKMSIGVAPPQP